ncbi:MAG: hypothetical protein BWZ10_00574 [candidate division BRC1 bacterium ADurb.BinA364]|nr:MAG: hypothetical protein BWZ10_00574 [candidate division BRC1 bacterium ADurb.BinA364]
MDSGEKDICCPRFDPAPWDGQEKSFEGIRFVKDRVRSFFHIPLNFGSVMKRNCIKIESADAMPPEPLALCDENSLWGADVYIAAAKDISGATMRTMPGTYLCKVFEGPYRDVGKWIREMKAYVESRGQEMKKLLFFYTTCPRCARMHGKNYVVLLAEI